jgi:hypothetical protein
MRHQARDRDLAMAARDGRTADEAIASIDSSGVTRWAHGPVPGVGSCPCRAWWFLLFVATGCATASSV